MIEFDPIEAVGRPGPHSSIYSDGKTTVKVRKPDDTIGNFYFRLEIDRNGVLMLTDMRDEEDRDILQAAVSTLHDQGHIAILDAGCGTGHSLNRMREELISRTGLPTKVIAAVGVNDVDFSDESEELTTRDAIANGNIRYVVDDLETVKLPKKSFDLITSYEVLIHNKPPKIAAIIKNLLPSLKDDGLFILDIHPFQKYDPTLKAFLEEELVEMGYKTSEYRIITDCGLTERIFIRIRRNPPDEK
jgi:SAM-dependent methyltransferase